MKRLSDKKCLKIDTEYKNLVQIDQSTELTRNYSAKPKFKISKVKLNLDISTMSPFQI